MAVHSPVPAAQIDEDRKGCQLSDPSPVPPTKKQVMSALLKAPDEQFLQRSRGDGRLSAIRLKDQTRLKSLYQQGCAKLRIPAQHGAGALEAVMINTSGGLTGGDRLRWAFDAGPETAITITTQASEKVYKSVGGVAKVRSIIGAGEGASVAWLPQETILFDRSGLNRELLFDLADGASLLACEAVIFGRTGHAERLETGSFRDRWRIRCGGRLIHAEDVILGDEIGGRLASAAIAGGAGAMATVVSVGRQNDMFIDQARASVAAGADDLTAISFVPLGDTGKLIARLLAEDGYSLRKVLVPLLQLLNGGAALPKLWAS